MTRRAFADPPPGALEPGRAPIASAIAPWLTVRDGERALQFYGEAFGAAVVYRMADHSAGVVARLSVAGAEFWVSDGQPAGPEAEALGGGSVRMILTVADPDVGRLRAALGRQCSRWVRRTVGDWGGWSTRSVCTGKSADLWRAWEQSPLGHVAPKCAIAAPRANPRRAGVSPQSRLR